MQEGNTLEPACPGDITWLLARWSAGDDPGMNALLPHIYEELCTLARRHLKDAGGQTLLQTQVLVHELWLRLERSGRGDFPSRGHFFAYAGKTLRSLLIRHAREKQAQKRGQGHASVPLDPERDADRDAFADPERLIALDEALTRLALQDPRSAQVVELKFFGGLGIDEIAVVLDISKNTVTRDWAFARYWLSNKLGPYSHAIAPHEEPMI